MFLSLRLKGELAYNYKGPRTKDDVIEFANRVAGPAVRSLPSRQMFEHVLKRHSVLFLYIGGEVYRGGVGAHCVHVFLLCV